MRIHFFYIHFASILTNFSPDASLVVIHERNASLSQAPATSQEPCTRQTRVKHWMFKNLFPLGEAKIAQNFLWLGGKAKKF